MLPAYQVGLYQGVGFQLIGPSGVVHGKDTWLEMVHQMGVDEEL